LAEPLVENMITETEASAAQTDDLEAARAAFTLTNTRRFRIIASSKTKTYYVLLFLLFLAVLIVTGLVGLFATQYAQQQEVFGAMKWGGEDLKLAEEDNDFKEADFQVEFNPQIRVEMVPINEDGSPALGGPVHFVTDQSKQPAWLREVMKKVREIIRMDIRHAVDREKFVNEGPTIEETSVIEENIEMDLKDNSYEKIQVPTSGLRFVHDFYTNYTAFVDDKEKTCFVTPLDRSIFPPPNGMQDLLEKMQSGFYNIDVEKISDTFRVVQPAIENMEPYGRYIAFECLASKSYKLEKVTGGLVKREATEGKDKSVVFFVGDKMIEYKIQNIPMAEPIPVSVA